MAKFYVVRVNQDSSDTFAAPTHAEAIEMAMLGEGDTTEVRVVDAPEAGAARLMFSEGKAAVSSLKGDKKMATREEIQQRIARLDRAIRHTASGAELSAEVKQKDEVDPKGKKMPVIDEKAEKDEKKASLNRVATSRIARQRLSAMLNTAADCFECLENAEKTEGVSAETKMARRDLADFMDKVATLTEKVRPDSPMALREIRGLERSLERFPR
jgi:hypothetical protein